MIKVNVKEFRDTVSKMNMAIEKSKINPKSGWIEVETISDSTMIIKVANYDYYLVSSIAITCDDYTDESKIHATVTSDTFVPLVSKLDDGFISMFERMNSLILSTDSGEYTFPIIKELDKVRELDEIKFNPDGLISVEMDGMNVSSIADKNAKGLVDSLFSKEIQQFIYVDNIGALTFTENIYINNFDVSCSNEFKMLLNGTQAKLLKVFDGFNSVKVEVEKQNDYSVPFKVRFSANDVDVSLSLVMIVQSMEKTDKFPCIKLRELANKVSETHVVINKKDFEKALSRLMVFDKKFDITVMNYSKLVFSENEVKLVSIKNKNHEIVKYKSHTNSSDHESIIRFADLVNQLKAIQSNEIDISYGDSPAIVINSDGLKQLIPEIRQVEKV